MWNSEDGWHSGSLKLPTPASANSQISAARTEKRAIHVFYQDAADRLVAGVYVSGAGWTGLVGATAPPLVDARGSGLAAVNDPAKGIRVLHQDPAGSLTWWAADTPAEKWANGTITTL